MNSTIQFYLKVLIFIILTLYTVTGILSLFLPSWLLYAPYALLSSLNVCPDWKVYIHRLYRSYVRITGRIFGSFVILLLFVFTPGSRLVLTGDHSLQSDDLQIVMANHQIYPDWLYLWAYARHLRKHGDVKVLLMAVLKYLPLLGWGMQFFEFIFLQQKWVLDKDRITQSLHTAMGDRLPLWLLIFPEVRFTKRV